MNAATVLLLVDVQNDFLPGGRLAVPRGDEVVPVINRIAARFANVILTQDWHPPGHVSFASAHAGRKPFETIELPYGRQVLWPDHCVQASPGAGFAAGLSVPHAQAVIRKGYHAHADSYSALLEADRATPTGLAGMLRERAIPQPGLHARSAWAQVRHTLGHLGQLREHQRVGRHTAAKALPGVGVGRRIDHAPAALTPALYIIEHQACPVSSTTWGRCQKVSRTAVSEKRSRRRSSMRSAQAWRCAWKRARSSCGTPAPISASNYRHRLNPSPVHVPASPFR